jgi:hypothetical protein
MIKDHIRDTGGSPVRSVIVESHVTQDLFDVGETLLGKYSSTSELLEKNPVVAR